jgi:hypothetical protein
MPAFVSNLFLIFFLVFLGITGLIIWAVIYMQKRPVGQEEKAERAELINEVLSKRAKLASWDQYSMLNLRPNASYKYVRGLSRNSFSGRLMADDGEYVLAFYRIERGLDAIGSIAAATTAFELFFIIEKDRTECYYNRKKIGTVLKSGNIYNKDGKQIGFVNRSNQATISIGSLVDIHTGESAYDFVMNGRKLAHFYVTPRISNFIGGFISINENSGNQIVQLLEEPHEEEMKWLESWTVYELIYHGFWFTEV